MSRLNKVMAILATSIAVACVSLPISGPAKAAARSGGAHVSGGAQFHHGHFGSPHVSGGPSHFGGTRFRGSNFGSGHFGAPHVRGDADFGVTGSKFTAGPYGGSRLFGRRFGPAVVYTIGAPFWDWPYDASYGDCVVERHWIRTDWGLISRGVPVCH
jgi:hypothetical protein